eukprot:TRINITY_DN5409_c0_g1_i3.p2 TRINITY_DN5409_c0_g1~~TRINITY_DN5409_c0_g1_i3.p2  ORF type:complete len:111 (-),score=19.58 TRINITY_DN5409_c0_g1_i3:482-814(-)
MCIRDRYMGRTSISLFVTDFPFFLMRATGYKGKTSNADNFGSKTLIANWYEERCDPDSKAANFYVERKTPEPAYRSTMTKITFQTSAQNWLNYQPYDSAKTFQTTTQQES